MSEPASSPHTPERWGIASRGYAAHVAPRVISGFIDSLIERLDVESATCVLEVGAGSGAMTERLAPRVRSLLATDFAPEMLEVLETRMREAEISNIEYRVMDGQALDLEDNTVDAAASSFAVMLFPDRARGFSELCRVVRPGGRVVVSAWAGPDRFEIFGLFLTGVREAFPDMPPPQSPPPIFSLADPAVFAEEMVTAGFGDVAVEFESREVSVPDFDTVWTMLTAGAPPVQVLLDRVGTDGQDRLKEALARVVDDRYGAGPIELTNVATVGSGVAT